MTIQVREYATLTTDKDSVSSIDLGIVSQSTFDWLIELQQQWQQKAGVLLTRNGHAQLKLNNYVGYLESPAGESIEILPKIEHSPSATPEQLRKLLCDMLKVALGIQGRQADSASLKTMKQPIHEWVMGQFLQELANLVKRGLRFDYQTIEDNCNFIRGQLDMVRQLRQTPDKANRFHVRYDEFTPDRIENRLLRTSLDWVIRLTKSADNWRLANTLIHQLIDIKPVSNPIQLFHKWADTKHLITYRKIKPWCKLILEMLNPNFQKGTFKGIAMLFPMEQLFESYIGFTLHQQLTGGYTLTQQSNRHYLVRHQPSETTLEQSWFNLKPDFLIEKQHSKYVLDAKWKLLNEAKNTSEHKYGISQSDLYQMFAYGHKYLSGKGKMMLIYPLHKGFNTPLPVFRFDGQIDLWCVPFDLYNNRLVEGEWLNDFSCFKPNVES